MIGGNSNMRGNASTSFWRLGSHYSLIADMVLEQTSHTDPEGLQKPHGASYVMCEFPSKEANMATTICERHFETGIRVIPPNAVLLKTVILKTATLEKSTSKPLSFETPMYKDNITAAGCKVGSAGEEP